MSDKTFHVLFVCAGNSDRSIMAESILNRLGGHKFKAFSAGSQPSGGLHTETLELLKRLHYDTDSLRSKSWSEFVAAGAPEMDFIFILDEAVDLSAQPAWTGQPLVAKWATPDPQNIEETGAQRALKLAEIYKMLDTRLAIFVNLRMDALDGLALRKQIEDLGKST